VRLALPGLHNVLNALAAVAVGLELEVAFSHVADALAAFHGVGRRFEIVGEWHGATVIDDYAHHPTEIAATLKAARGAYPGRRLVAVFQPHLYSRTRDFAAGFADALAHADLAVVLDIYPAREAPLPGVTAALITVPLRRAKGEEAVLELEKENMMAELAKSTRPGDVVVMMGAGDIGEVGRRAVPAPHA
jgi:UDP-N-acetylmuramate--alanine ligase